MERGERTCIVDNFISNWNQEFPEFQLRMDIIKIPAVFMEALFHIFNKLGVDIDAVSKPPPESQWDEHTIYYLDLIPVINVTRLTKHFLSVMPDIDDMRIINITNFLQPTVNTSHSILLLLFNFMIFNKQKFNEIEPYEEELFSRREQVQVLEDRKNKLIELLNQQATEKGKRKEKIAKIKVDIELYERELKEEKEAHEIDTQEKEVIEKQHLQIELAVEQKKAQQDAVLAEANRIKSLRVYDAEDILAQAEQASRKVQEADEKILSLKNILMEKENDLKNLQTLKPGLDTADNVLDEIEDLSNFLQDSEQDDGNLNSVEESVLLLEEMLERMVQRDAARVNAYKKNQENQTKRQNEKETKHSVLRETEDKERKCEGQYKKVTQRVLEVKDATRNYDREKSQTLAEMEQMISIFKEQLIKCEETLMKKIKETQAKIEAKLV